MDDQLQLGFQFANELSKQLLTLSTGVLAISITFQKDVLKSSALVRGAGWLKFAWLCLLLTIIVAVLHMHKLTGILLPAEPMTATGVDGVGRALGLIELLLFGAGIGGLLVFGFRSLRSDEEAQIDGNHGKL